MKRIKQIIEALRTTRKDAPGAVIHEAWNNIQQYIDNAIGDGSLHGSDVDLIASIMSAVIDIAEDAMKSAKPVAVEVKP